MKYIWLLISLVGVLITYPVFANYILKIENQASVPAIKIVQEAKSVDTLRVMTFNIQHGKGIDGQIDLSRIAQLIQETSADIVGLNEVDHFLPRSGLKNQLKFLGQKTEMNYFFAPGIDFGLGKYGNGVLTRSQVSNPLKEALPRIFRRESRVLLQFATLVSGQKVQIIVTHLGLNPVEKEKQLAFLTEKIQKITEPVILMGDFNLTPHSSLMRNFLQNTGLKSHSNEQTFPADNPNLKLDYILTSEQWEVVSPVEVISTQSSDHFALAGTFRLK